MQLNQVESFNFILHCIHVGLIQDDTIYIFNTGLMYNLYTFVCIYVYMYVYVCMNVCAIILEIF